MTFDQVIGWFVSVLTFWGVAAILFFHFDITWWAVILIMLTVNLYGYGLAWAKGWKKVTST